MMGCTMITDDHTYDHQFYYSEYENRTAREITLKMSTVRLKDGTGATLAPVSFRSTK